MTDHSPQDLNSDVRVGVLCIQVASWLEDPCGTAPLSGSEKEPYVMCDLEFDTSWVCVTKVPLILLDPESPSDK